MKRLNIKLLAIVGIIFVVLTGSLVVVHGIQMNRNIDTLLKRAEAAKKDDMKTALQLFQRYQAYKPDDLERSAEFATLLADKAQITFQSRDYGAAHSMMIQAITGLEQHPELKSTMLDLKHRLIDLNIAWHSYGDARDDLLKLKNKGESDPKYDLQLALCYVNTVEYAKARSLLESLVGYDNETKVFNVAKATAPHELAAYGSLANLLRDKMRDEEAPDRIAMADRVIDQMVSVNSDSARAFLVQAEYLAAYQSRDKARPAVEKALELAPEDDEVLLHAAELYLGADELDKAAAPGAKGNQQIPEGFTILSSRRNGCRCAEKSGRSQAETERTGLEALPRDVPLLYMALDRQIKERDFDGARLTLKKLTYAGLRPEWRDYSEARILVTEGNMLQARQVLEPLQLAVQKIPQLSPLVDTLMVQCYTALNQPDRLRAAAGRISNTAEGQIGQAIAEYASGQNDKALSRFEGLAKLMEQNNQLAKSPQFYAPIFQLRISKELHQPKEKRDWKEADSLLAKLREQNVVKEPALSLMEITLLTAKGEKETAQQTLDELRKKYPNDVGVLVASNSIRVASNPIPFRGPRRRCN